MFQSNDVGIILKALHFASVKHKDQRRKDIQATPYINHPIEVAEILWNLGEIYDPVVIISALLHDTIEDTETTSEEIRNLFGIQICSIVEEVTDDKGLAKAERKQRQIEKASKISREAQFVKLADKISNVRGLASNCPKGWNKERCSQYVQWAEQVVQGMKGINTRLEKEFSLSCEKARKHIQETSFGE